MYVSKPYRVLGVSLELHSGEDAKLAQEQHLQIDGLVVAHRQNQGRRIPITIVLFTIRCYKTLNFPTFQKRGDSQP